VSGISCCYSKYHSYHQQSRAAAARGIPGVKKGALLQQETILIVNNEGLLL
jgi:hypothetical protein